MLTGLGLGKGLKSQKDSLGCVSASITQPKVSEFTPNVNTDTFSVYIITAMVALKIMIQVTLTIASTPRERSGAKVEVVIHLKTFFIYQFFGQ